MRPLAALLIVSSAGWALGPTPQDAKPLTPAEAIQPSGPATGVGASGKGTGSHGGRTVLRRAANARTPFPCSGAKAAF